MDPTAIETAAEFSEACGGGGALELEVGDPGCPTDRLCSLNQPFAVVGRSPDSDVVLDHEHVSWRHCYLQRLGSYLVCIDLNSQNGVALEGVVQRIGWVGPGQSLHVGPVALRFRGPALGGGLETAGGPGGSTPVPPLSAQYARNLPPAALEIEGGGGNRYGWRMSRALALIGRSPDCQVRLLDDRISKFHAALVRTPSGLWVVDLLSRGGLKVGGARVRAARLEEGGGCRLGPFTLRYYRETRAPAPPRRSRSSQALPAEVRPGTGDLVRPGALPGQSSIPAPAWPVPVGSAGQGTPPPTLAPVWERAEAGADPYHHAVMTLAQMLGAMHNDHMSLVRDELTEIRRLAEEMHALRQEIGRRPAEQPPAASGALPNPGTVPTDAPLYHPGAIPPGFPLDPAMAASSLAPGEAMPPLLDQPVVPRDPKECLEIASHFLASYEQRQSTHWKRILRVLSGLTGTTGIGSGSARGPLGQAPLG